FLSVGRLDVDSYLHADGHGSVLGGRSSGVNKA
ncbi:MAG: hypothetical protein ACD_57C00347G0002, partial [uncultured bacterium]